VLVVAVLTVRRARTDELRRFETAAARIMARHGGAIERTVVLDDPPGGAPGQATFRELHLVRFPDEAAHRAYRADPELAALAALRAEAIEATEIWTGTDGPVYG
jgi:uncharacterized protein (DUF1330 family)